MNTPTEQLKWILQALAQPANVQITLYPDFAETADELALEFEEVITTIRESGAWDTLTPQQTKPLAELDHTLDQMSGEENEHFWTNEALRSDAAWEEIRELALTTLLVMDWKPDVPPFSRGWIYVSGD